MRAYKYVREEFAESTSLGVFSIGTASYYREYEGPLADQRDEAVEYVAGNGQALNLAALTDEHRDRFRRLGLELPRAGNNLVFAHNTFRQVLPPAYMLCLSRNSDSQHLLGMGLTAVFEVEDAFRLAHLIRVAHSSRLADFTVQPVTYERREFDMLSEPIVSPNPYIKDPAFEGEAEIRIRWGLLEPNDPPRFLTSAPRASRVLRRVR